MRALRLARILAVLVFVVAALSCETPTDPVADPADVLPNLAIVDAAHDGARGFYFLPPLVKRPKRFAGRFDANRNPVVRICRWVDDDCADPDIVFRRSKPGEWRIRVDREGKKYYAKWRDTDALAVGDVYRLRVYKSRYVTTPLGYADILIVASEEDETQVPEGIIGLARGTHLHIRFRIEKGAVGLPEPEEPDEAPAVAGTTPVDLATGVATSSNIDVTFDEPVNVIGGWFGIECGTSGTRTPAETTVTGGPTSFTINPDVDFAVGETCDVTIFAAQVTDQDTNDPPDNMAADHTFEFTLVTVLAPAPVNDGPAANSAPGDPFHAHLNVPIVVLAPGLLANDVLGVPAGRIVSFGGGSLGGGVAAFPAGETINFGLTGQLTVNANGGFAFRPSSGFTGSFTFQYRVANEIGSGDATVTIFVGPRP